MVPARFVAILPAAALIFSAGPAAPAAWPLDDQAGRVTIEVGKAGLLKVAGHNHEVIASGWTGRLEFDRLRPGESALRLTFPVSGLRVNEKKEPEGDAPKVQEAMLGPRCLDAAAFPTIIFESTAVAVEARSDTTLALRITGKLFLHGVERPFSFPASLSFRDSTLTARGRFGIKQRDFGIKPITAGVGTVKVRNEVFVNFDIEVKS